MSRPSFAKRDRERAKKAKADAKRERRQSGVDHEIDDDVAVDDAPTSTLPTPEVLELLEEVHRRHADGEIDDEEFQTVKAELLAQIAID